MTRERSVRSAGARITSHSHAARSAEANRAPLTVVVPVWNEGARFGAWWEAASPHLPPGATVLVVHDRDDDDTLPVIRTLSEQGAPVRPLRSRGVGFPDAMLTGLRAVACGPVLVTMADLSDGLEAVPAMLAAWAAGADVVVGSRYMPGGRQAGGHRLKAHLARWGSAVLFHVAGLPVRDASNAFRLYDAERVARLRLPPAAGFEVALALLVEAWRDGARIVEVPVAWSARTAGKSRFRWRWLARYGRLWLSALGFGLRARWSGRGGGQA